MGNQLNNRKFIKSNFNKIKTENDEFIIKYSHENKLKDLTNIKSFDPRRKVIVSLMGLYLTWKSCPTNVIYSAILLLPLKSKWIYSPLKYIDEISCVSVLSSAVFADLSEMQQFIRMLQWKDRQGLIVWLLNDYSDRKVADNELIHPAWNYISDKLVELKMNKLNLDMDWWKNEGMKTSVYDTTYCNIISEFYFLSMKFKTMKEIMHQSNPDTLHPIESYISAEQENNKPEYRLCKLNSVESDCEDDTDNWMISSNYDPNDIDQCYH